MLSPLDLMITLFYVCPYFVYFCESSISLSPNILCMGVGWGENNLCMFKYIKHIYFIFSFFSEACPSWRSLSSCSTQDCFSRPSAELASWKSSFIIILRISFIFLCLVSPSLLDPIHFSQFSLLF